MLQLLDNQLQLEKTIDISHYAGELLSHAQPTPGVLHTLSTPRRLLQLSVTFRLESQRLPGWQLYKLLYSVLDYTAPARPQRDSLP